MMKRYLISAIAAACVALLFGSAYFAKINGIHGLDRAHFSFLQCILPLAGMLCGVFGSVALFFASLGLKSLGMIHLTYFGLPTFCASLCWTSYNRAVKIGISLVCMVLFIAHPIGLYAAPYALYWLIPIACAFAGKNRFLTALSSTFVAHAVGSVMHLYMVNAMSSAAWLALIPIVAIERLVLALGMYVAFGCVSRLIYLGSVALRDNLQQRPAID